MGALLNALPALEGFFTIGVLILVGWFLAKVGVFTADHRKLLSRLAFYVASPALMYSMLVTADLHRVFARPVIASYGAIVAAGLVYLAVTTVAFRHDVSGRVVGTLLSCYSNAGNLGIPVAVYALRDVTWVVPIMLIQMIILQPTALALLDAARARAAGRRSSVGALLSRPVRNPLTVGVLLGVIVNLIHLRVGWFALPTFAQQPITMVGAVAVPVMLLGFGISLRLDPKPAKGPDERESWMVVAIKVLVQPLAAWLIAVRLGLDPSVVRAVTLVAALPSAQNIFVFASTYDVRLTFARDTIFRATAASMVVILVGATVLA